MTDRYRTMFLLVLIAICPTNIVKGQNKDLQHGNYFHKYLENKQIEGEIPIFKGNLSSESECWLKCKQERNCVAAQIELVEQQQPNYQMWFCSLFNTAKKFTFKTLANLYIFETLRDCADWQKYGHRKDGVYEIGNVNGDINRISLFCDMTTDGGGWMVFQRRLDGSLLFNRSWEEYKNGFGDTAGEYWLGNEILHQLTRGVRMKIYIEAETFSGERGNSSFEGFWIEDEGNNYKLHSGTLTENDMIFKVDWPAHDGREFSTANRGPQDGCASKYASGWWFHLCFHVNMNGIYPATGAVQDYGKCVCSRRFLSLWASFRKTKMMIKRIT